MRWWLNTDSPKVFSVDNAAVKGMDFSALEPDIWMVQWTEGKGEIERQDEDGNNLNGLREQFIDITPYAPLFQQFLTKMTAKALLLPQAKKIQTDLIREIFESKRQAPFYYPVAAGDYWWDATDANMFSSTVPTLQNTITSLNNVITELNRVVAGFNAADGQIETGANTANNQIGAAVNLAIGDINIDGNNLAAQINANVVYYCNIAFDQVGSWLVTIDARGNGLVGYINATLVGSMNSYLITNASSVAAPGIPVVGVTSSDSSFPDIGQPYRAQGVVATFAAAGASWSAISRTPVSWTNLAPVAITNTVWIPFGETTPVTVTPTESAAIMQGIAARTNDLNVKKNIKIGEVNALTTVPAVIAYDVTTGW